MVRVNKVANEIVVSVGRMGGDAKRVSLTGTGTIREALQAVGLNKKSSELVQINGDEINQNNVMDYKLKEGDQIILTRNIEGGLIK